MITPATTAFSTHSAAARPAAVKRNSGPGEPPLSSPSFIDSMCAAEAGGEDVDAGPATSGDTAVARKHVGLRGRDKDRRSQDRLFGKKDAQESSQGPPQVAQAALVQQGPANNVQAVQTAPVTPPDTPNPPTTVATARANEQPGNGSVGTASIPTVEMQAGNGVASVAAPALNPAPASALPEQPQQPACSETSAGSPVASQAGIVAAGAAQALNQSASDAQPAAAFGASSEEVPAQTASDAEVGSASSGDDNAITPAGAQTAARAVAGGTRSAHAVALFDRIAADLVAGGAIPVPASGQSGLPGSASGQANGETSSATAAQDEKHHAPAPGHDGKAADQSPTPSPAQNPIQNQIPPPAGKQNPSATQASATAYVAPAVIAHAGNMAAPIATTHHPASGAGAFAGTQIGEAGAATAQALAPAVNSARLIQRMGEAEIRVGMRSSDFGNVSISTLATRNSISAQISLDHADLAKAIATHLPEVQARLGISQPVDVRISPTPMASGQVGTLSGGMQQNAGQGQAYSRGQQNYARAPDIAVRGPGTFGPPATVAVEEIAFGRGRLDIRA